MIPDDLASLREAVEAYEAATTAKDRLEGILRIEAIFDEDNRVELAAAPKWAQNAARSVAAVWPVENFTAVNGQVRLCTRRLADSLPICGGPVPVFGGQLIPCHNRAYGTAFVVRLEAGELALLTARHVVEREGFAGLACLFGYHGAVPPGEVPASEVIRFSRIVDQGLGLFNDWVLLEPGQPLDGSVHPPLEVHRGAVPGQEVFTLGFPFGVPMKFADHARVRFIDKTGVHTDLDTAKGNSGSPVFALVEGRAVVIGVAYESPRDFEDVSGCKAETPCKLTVQQCAAGTIAVPISAIPGLV